MSFQSVVINKPQLADTDAVVVPVAPMDTVAQKSTGSENRSATGQYALKVIDLSKSFKSGFLKRKIRGIDGVSFTVKKGEIFAIVGHNGAGKTTTINCILDLVHADRGEISIFDSDSNSPASRAKIGYLPERPYFFEHLTGQELLEFYGKLLGFPEEKLSRRIDEVLAQLGIAEFRTRKLRKFSKGMLQRIGLAQAILGKPELLILDEPMSGLDPVGRKEVRELILELKASGCTIILSSHIVPDVEMLADSVMILKEGQVILQEELSNVSGDFSYTVKLIPKDVSSSVFPAWAGKQFNSMEGATVAIAAGSVVELQELLSVCHANQITIQSVETHRTALEDLFMKANSNMEVSS